MAASAASLCRLSNYPALQRQSRLASRADTQWSVLSNEFSSGVSICGQTPSRTGPHLGSNEEDVKQPSSKCRNRRGNISPSCGSEDVLNTRDLFISADYPITNQ